MNQDFSFWLTPLNQRHVTHPADILCIPFGIFFTSLGFLLRNANVGSLTSHTSCQRVSEVRIFLKENYVADYVVYNLRESWYDRDTHTNKEKHKGFAKLADVVRIAKQPRHIFQVMALFFALERLRLICLAEKQALDEFLHETIMTTLFDLILFRVHFPNLTTGFQEALHAHYRNALNTALSESALLNCRAIGLRISARSGNLRIPGSVMDSKGRITVPRPLQLALRWKPGDSFRFRSENGVLVVERSKAAPSVWPYRESSSLIVQLLTQYSEHSEKIAHRFLASLLATNLVEPRELERAVENGRDLTRIQISARLRDAMRRSFGVRDS
jgi:bifunctional DNA-binding transcriptional regulator/antitoxin component of YhaV-PrlF toxin-antitoxin module